MKPEYGMDGERIYPHWDCPKCDAPNAGAEHCNPRARKRPKCDECGAAMIYRGDYGHDEDNGPYNFARITTEDGGFDEECRVSVAETLLQNGALASFDGVVRHGSASEHLYTVPQANVKRVAASIKAATESARL